VLAIAIIATLPANAGEPGQSVEMVPSLTQYGSADTGYVYLGVRIVNPTKSWGTVECVAYRGNDPITMGSNYFFVRDGDALARVFLDTGLNGPMPTSFK
jgi:hypothetical protein